MRVKKATKKRFDSLGVKGETDDALLNRLLDELEQLRKQQIHWHIEKNRETLKELAKK